MPTGLASAPPAAPLLCCICSEKNTTFRYEVVYSQQNKSITLLESTEEERQCLTHPESNLGASSSLEEGSSLSENAYYNFPPRHPRHGHLSWPVWTPTTSSTIANTSQLSITYPDHPIHIPTLTLRRLYSQLASQGRGDPGIQRISSKPQPLILCPSSDLPWLRA